jgi:hypothetical protein
MLGLTQSSIPDAVRELLEHASTALHIMASKASSPLLRLNTQCETPVFRSVLVRSFSRRILSPTTMIVSSDEEADGAAA